MCRKWKWPYSSLFFCFLVPVLRLILRSSVGRSFQHLVWILVGNLRRIFGGGAPLNTTKVSEKLAKTSKFTSSHQILVTTDNSVKLARQKMEWRLDIIHFCRQLPTCPKTCCSLWKQFFTIISEVHHFSKRYIERIFKTLSLTKKIIIIFVIWYLGPSKMAVPLQTQFFNSCPGIFFFF